MCIKQSVPVLLRQPLATTSLLSVLVGVPVLDASCKWGPAVRGGSCLAVLTQHHVFEVHPRGSGCWCFIPFYDWLIAHCMDGPHLVYPSPLDGHGLLPPAVP